MDSESATPGDSAFTCLKNSKAAVVAGLPADLCKHDIEEQGAKACSTI